MRYTCFNKQTKQTSFCCKPGDNWSPREGNEAVFKQDDSSSFCMPSLKLPKVYCPTKRRARNPHYSFTLCFPSQSFCHEEFYSTLQGQSRQRCSGFIFTLDIQLSTSVLLALPCSKGTAWCFYESDILGEGVLQDKVLFPLPSQRQPGASGSATMLMPGAFKNYLYKWDGI